MDTFESDVVCVCDRVHFISPPTIRENLNYQHRIVKTTAPQFSEGAPNPHQLNYNNIGQDLALPPLLILLPAITRSRTRSAGNYSIICRRYVVMKTGHWRVETASGVIRGTFTY